MSVHTQVSLRIHYVGIDIAKDYLQLYWDVPPALAKSLRLPPRVDNNPKAIAGLLRLAARLQSALGHTVHLVCEPTGACERALLIACWKANVPVCMPNAARVRSFANSKGRMAKTDPLDARILTAYARAMAPAPTRPASASQRRLVELAAERQRLTDQRKRRFCSKTYLQEPDLIAHAKKQILHIDQQIQWIDKLIDQTLANDPIWQQRLPCLPRFQGWLKPPPQSSWLMLPNWEPCAEDRSPLWQAWLPSITTAEPSGANAASATEDLLCVPPSTCPLSRLPNTIPS